MLARLFNFHGGIKPAYHKEASTRQPCAVPPAPSFVAIPLHQSLGGVPRPLVTVGQSVRKGETIGAADGDNSPAVHASVSGVVRAIELRTMPHTSGLAALCVVIETDGRDEWLQRPAFDIAKHSPQTAREYLRDMGIVGLGGAVFPTHTKLNPGRAGRIDSLIVNGAECEPYITCDDVLMRERAAGIVRGALLMRELIQANRVLIGVEDNKPEAIAALHAAIADLPNVAVVAVPTRYPAGGAKQLIRMLTGLEVPHGERSTDHGVQCFNVGTAYAVHEAIDLGRPLVSRIVTIAGNVRQPRNYDAPIGMAMGELAALAEPLPDSDRVIMGGPMMGFRMPSDEVPVVKATNCILVGSPKLFPPPPPEMPCIRCGECASACPADLQPFELYWFARGKQFGKAQEYHLFDCIECGCCAYVCPSRIPLVDYYRFAKSEIWAREREKEAADAARERHEFRQFREEREKEEKATRLAAKTAAGREKAAAALATVSDESPSATPATPEQDAKKALIAAALARAQAQRAEAQPANVVQLTPEQEAEIAAIEARRAEIRTLAKPHLPPDT